MRIVRPFYFDLPEDAIEEFSRTAAAILRSGVLILGEHTRRFEREFAAFVGTKHAIAVNSGSTGLEIMMRLKQVAGRVVLVPTNTNFATVAAIIRAGGQPRYLDMDPTTFAPTLEMVKKALALGGDVAGVLWVHIGGVISPEFPEVVRWCHERGLFVVEDAAHAHGSMLDGRHAGALADGGVFSFFPTKVMTTCEGGMITTDSDEEDYLARSLRNQGKRGVDYGGLHEDFGNSSRMTEINAALGLLQLRRLTEVISKRQAVYDVIAAALDAAGVPYVSTRHMQRASQYKLIVRLPAHCRLEEVKKTLAARGVIAGGGVYEIPCHRQPVFQGMVADAPCPNADRWCPNHLCPPLTSGMSTEDARFVAEALVEALS